MARKIVEAGQFCLSQFITAPFHPNKAQ